MKRIVPGLVLAGCWLLLLLNGSFSFFWLVVCCFTFLGSYEYLRMVLPESTTGVDVTTLAVTLSLPALLTGPWHEAGLSGGLFIAAFLSISYVLIHFSKLDDSLTVLTRLVFGTVFVGFFSGHLVLIHLLPEGNYWLVILVAITAGSDSGAYYCGRRWGKRKLCRHVSPNKTVEGALGGLACGIIIALVFALILLEGVNWLALLPTALIVTGAGIIGDLTESMVKRGTGTKDSGKILLGHGGILDRIDSLLLAAPLLYYLYIFTL